MALAYMDPPVMARSRKTGDGKLETKTGRPTKGKPVHIRLSEDILADLLIIERAHGTDTSGAIRMILTESRKSIVERAKEALKVRGESE